MGTLTAGQPRLDHYCDHKLPTSCRLSSIGECCACYDERAHSSYYSTYIDGVGYVPRGNRWQRYCWFCKEFWENRVNASGLRPAQTRIPEVPDQTDFLDRWYEFHQGYRIVKREDGTEERVAVLGEDLRHVDPGVLPRTLEELRAGRQRSELEGQEQERRHRQRQRQESASQGEPTETGPSLDETLDEMVRAAESEERAVEMELEQQATGHTQTPSPNQSNAGSVHAQAMSAVASRNREHQARRVAALRRQLHRMRNGIERVMSDLRDLGENLPDHAEASSRLSELGRTLDAISEAPTAEQANRVIHNVNALVETSATAQSDRTLANMQLRVDEARTNMNESRRNRDHAALELEAAEQDFRSSQALLSRLQNEQRTTENYLRLFGTREEMQAQGENYESPIGGMFTRAYERFRVAEEVRREERTLRQILEEEEMAGGEHVALATRLAELESRDRDVWGVPRTSSPPSPPPLRQTTITQYTSPFAAQQDATARSRVSSSASNQNLPEDDAGLEEYYALLRRQNWRNDRSESGQRHPREDLSPDQNGDAALLQMQNIRDQLTELEAANRARRERSNVLADIIASATESPDGEQASVLDTQDIINGGVIVAGPPGAQLDADPSTNNDRGFDAVYVLRKLCQNAHFRAAVLPDASLDQIARWLEHAENNVLTADEKETIEGIMENDDVVWNSGLPAEKSRRRRQRGESVTFSTRLVTITSRVITHDIEMMAETFQMSSRIRELSALTVSEQIQMLDRLQAGERNFHDRNVLAQMMRNNGVLSLARTVHEQRYGELAGDSGSNERIANLNRDRMDAARQGDYSRSELDAQRRATRTLALAAGRAAMRTGPRALLEQMANRDEATRVAYERLQQNGFAPGETMSTRRLRDTFYRPLSFNDFTASPSATDSEGEEEEAGGLDAKDTGRPDEPLSEEQMTVKLDCQICYSQMADVACLPCGHLVMCKWCSDQHSPCMAHDKTRPKRPASCPVCRKQIRQKYRVFRM